MAKITTVPCYYYPTTAVFVDDSEQFLTKINLMLDPHLSYVSLSDTQEVLNYIAEHRRSHSLSDDYLLRQGTLNLEAITRELSSPQRFNEPSVFVLDYAMPGMNGLELCEHLRTQYPSKKILLTGQVGESVGVTGFNQGLIDRFFSKRDPQYGAKINQAVQELQTLFFLEQSASLLSYLSRQSSFCLQDPQFVQAFQAICQENQIVEYYLVSLEGDFFLLPFNGAPLWLIVATEEERAKGEKASYLESAQKISGTHTNYYYALSNTPYFDAFPQDKIMGFKHYLEYIWPPI